MLRRRTNRPRCPRSTLMRTAARPSLPPRMDCIVITPNDIGAKAARAYLLFLRGWLHLGQPQPCASARLLSGEERFIDVRQVLRADAGAGVAHGNLHPLSGLDTGHGRAPADANRHMAQADVQHAAIGHGIAGVERQVGDDLLELGRCCGHGEPPAGSRTVSADPVRSAAVRKGSRWHPGAEETGRARLHRRHDSCGRLQSLRG